MLATDDHRERTTRKEEEEKVRTSNIERSTSNDEWRITPPSSQARTPPEKVFSGKC